MCLHNFSFTPLPSAQFIYTTLPTDRYIERQRGIPVVHVLSPAAAISQGTTPEQLILVAEYHERRADVIAKALKRGKPARAFGETVTQRDLQRHIDTATKVRLAAREVARLLPSFATAGE